MKKKFTLSLCLLIALQGILCSNYSTAQNVGIGTATPSEKLDVLGNLKFSGALMPNNNAGTVGRILMSAGPGVPPTWGPPLLNSSATTNIGKFYVNGITLNSNSVLTLTVTDANCVAGSQISVSWAGLLPGSNNQNALIKFFNVQAGAGQFKVVIGNENNAATYSGLSLVFTAFY
ncbi:MAG TPA: hypothetical protein VI757_13470 [Bacteroidia bacterium]|nr:hypothetical protein [Bacteroidia bacterium]